MLLSFLEILFALNVSSQDEYRMIRARAAVRYIR